MEEVELTADEAFALKEISEKFSIYYLPVLLRIFYVNFVLGLKVELKEFVNISRFDKKKVVRRIQGSLLTFQSYYFCILAILVVVASFIQLQLLPLIFVSLAYFILRDYIPFAKRATIDFFMFMIISLGFLTIGFRTKIFFFVFPIWIIIVLIHASLSKKLIARIKNWSEILLNFITFQKDDTVATDIFG
ncbi:MAG: hypothetical protein EZS28_018190 [Streblomastix strix]|uniref:PRA1 family protein n=1 Tax=Streblomastix strix TaxID=222440 RepID=A0A5J4VUU1_9EUKA|nr:MAG: hypothetical protein EZS28_018190 [Streblomastix strix]